MEKDKLPVILQSGRTKFIFDSLETNCDHDYVEYFRKVPNTTFLFTFRVMKTIPTFNIDIVLSVLKTNRVLYKAEDIKGCDLVKNPRMFKNFGRSFTHLVVNGSYFKCPIEPRIYYLQNEPLMSMFPSVHLAGHFQLSMRLKIPNSYQPFVMESTWKYKISRVK
ncbi:uncharacterized protein LOC108022053 [Drosophila biarmipes]|uniref:uncharacterized protein LOC108022053 n=1 Tax=Drosophila biarmipes TaxID=125945 RepID=UPI0007E70035|nr:uncharacterized protein LOC108022053 [Drosophila biarmipes]